MLIVSVTDRKHCVRPLAEQIELICRGGADAVVLRERDLGRAEYMELAHLIMDICKSFGTEFIAHGGAERAEELGADGAWMTFAELEEKGRPAHMKAVVSVHSLLEAADACRLGADMLVFGNVCETSCKPGKPAAGFGALREVCASSSVPVLAIGGMDAPAARLAAEAGAAGVCLMSGLMSADDPETIVAGIRASSGRR